METVLHGLNKVLFFKIIKRSKIFPKDHHSILVYISQEYAMEAFEM